MADDLQSRLARLEKLKARAALDPREARAEILSTLAEPVEAEIVDPQEMHRADEYDSPQPPGQLPGRATKQDRSPAGTVKMARARLQRASLAMARRLEDMTEEAMRDAPPCPKCGRGLPRAEDIRLRAISTALDRAGVVPSRDAIDTSAESGPLLVFPPGTRIAVLAEPPTGGQR
jgi:hypothetical protein